MAYEKDQDHLSSAGVGLNLWGKVGPEYMPSFNLTAFVAKPLKQDIRGDTAERFVIQAGIAF